MRSSSGKPSRGQRDNAHEPGARRRQHDDKDEQRQPRRQAAGQPRPQNAGTDTRQRQQ